VEFQWLIWLCGAVKKIRVLLIVMILIITGCMLYLLSRGISLRTATLIKPSEMNSLKQVAQALTVRLYPELQSKSWLIYKASPESSRARELLVNFLVDIKTTPLTNYEIKTSAEDCMSHCLFINETEQSNEIYKKAFAEKLTMERSQIFRLNVIEFDRTENFIEECDSMQRLDEKCIRSLAIRDSLRKMKDPTKKYFFLKKYNHNDYYIFLEK
jgi:hypothetical protein